MNQVSSEAVAHSKNLNFEFSNTLRGQKINLNSYSSYTFIIDVDGKVYQCATASEESASIIIIGGIDKFVNEKAKRMAVNYFLTEQQKVTLYKILKEAAIYSEDAVISSSNESLNLSLSALYSNYCG